MHMRVVQSVVSVTPVLAAIVALRWPVFYRAKPALHLSQSSRWVGQSAGKQRGQIEICGLRVENQR